MDWQSHPHRRHSGAAWRNAVRPPRERDNRGDSRGHQADCRASTRQQAWDQNPSSPVASTSVYQSLPLSHEEYRYEEYALVVSSGWCETVVKADVQVVQGRPMVRVHRSGEPHRTWWLPLDAVMVFDRRLAGTRAPSHVPGPRVSRDTRGDTEHRQPRVSRDTRGGADDSFETSSFISEDSWLRQFDDTLSI